MLIINDFRIVAPGHADAGAEDERGEERVDAGEGRPQRAQNKAVRREIHPAGRGHFHR